MNVVKKARKEGVGCLGLDFLDNFGDADDMESSIPPGCLTALRETGPR